MAPGAPLEDVSPKVRGLCFRGHYGLQRPLPKFLRKRGEFARRIYSNVRQGMNLCGTKKKRADGFSRKATEFARVITSANRGFPEAESFVSLVWQRP